jgi:hypothetical protein
MVQQAEYPGKEETAILSALMKVAAESTKKWGHRRLKIAAI